MQFDTIAQVILERLQDAGFKGVKVRYERIAPRVKFARYWITWKGAEKMTWSDAILVATHAARGFEDQVVGPRVGDPEA